MESESKKLFLVSFYFNNDILNAKQDYYTWKQYTISILG